MTFKPKVHTKSANLPYRVAAVNGNDVIAITSSGENSFFASINAGNARHLASQGRKYQLGEAAHVEWRLNGNLHLLKSSAKQMVADYNGPELEGFGEARNEGATKFIVIFEFNLPQFVSGMEKLYSDLLYNRTPIYTIPKDAKILGVPA